MSAAQAELERRYRRLLRLYPREFRARREAEMLGVLMGAAGDDQWRPTAGDAADIAGRALLARLRGPRGGWPPALAAFTLLAPVFLVLTDILLVAVPHGRDYGGVQLLSQPSFLILAGGHLIVAAAVLAGLRRTAVAALLAAALVDCGHWAHLTSFNPLAPSLTTLLLTAAVFLLTAFALAVADPRAARRLVTWRHALTLLLLASAVEAWSLAAYPAAALPRQPANPYLISGFVLAGVALALPLALGLGWRFSLLSAAVCYPCALGVAFMYLISYSIVPTKVAMYLPPLLIACWSTARAARRPARRRFARERRS